MPMQQAKPQAARTGAVTPPLLNKYNEQHFLDELQLPNRRSDATRGQDGREMATDGTALPGHATRQGPRDGRSPAPREQMAFVPFATPAVGRHEPNHSTTGKSTVVPLDDVQADITFSDSSGVDPSKASMVFMMFGRGGMDLPTRPDRQQGSPY